MEAADLHQRGQPSASELSPLSSGQDMHETPRTTHSTGNSSSWSRIAQWFQDRCYQILAKTVWDRMVSGFEPGRVRAIQLMEIKTTDHILLVGEGSGLDFKWLPEETDKLHLKAFDFSPEMVRQCKIKAEQYGISKDNCFVGDAQQLPFTDEKFDKIFFPLSIASIPDPALALGEAERVLSVGGKVVIFEKLVDDDVSLTWQRRLLNVITKCLFADVTRNLRSLLPQSSDLKIVQYESLSDKLGGLAKRVGKYYRVAVLVRDRDYPDEAAVSCSCNHEKAD